MTFEGKQKCESVRLAITALTWIPGVNLWTELKKRAWAKRATILAELDQLCQEKGGKFKNSIVGSLQKDTTRVWFWFKQLNGNATKYTTVYVYGTHCMSDVLNKSWNKYIVTFAHFETASYGIKVDTFFNLAQEMHGYTKRAELWKKSLRACKILA